MSADYRRSSSRHGDGGSAGPKELICRDCDRSKRLLIVIIIIIVIVVVVVVIVIIII